MVDGMSGSERVRGREDMKAAADTKIGDLGLLIEFQIH